MAVKQAQINYEVADKRLCALLDSWINERLITLNAQAKNPEPLTMNVEGHGTIKIGLGGRDLELSIMGMIERGRYWGYDVGKWERGYETALKGEYNPSNNFLKFFLSVIASYWHSKRF